MLPRRAGNYDYLLAVERAQIAGFTNNYYTITDGDKLLAAMRFFSPITISPPPPRLDQSRFAGKFR